MRILYLIPARAGSKGVPGKNTKLLGNKPLIAYSIEFALENMKGDDMICVTTNDDDVFAIADRMGVKIPFKRPEELATDKASSYDVIMHALKFYENQGCCFDAILLLQPTSPFRSQEDFKNLIADYSGDTDMVVSVKYSKENPYFTLFEENDDGYLKKSKEGNFERRQDCPQVFALNGSMYLINAEAVKKSPLSEFKKIKKIIMPEERSIDIDTFADWNLAEFYLNNSK
ncbi:CMP-N,N'-diacetyllegionaminic acid synthase [compost metagenome]|uniref:acylneuraminate cytidylyltransferase family protein n=1 Tax=Pedobacter ghigonis TaxID=2730403 RepID=UPI000FA3E52A|nr:acylneuraminate cytidylyltransferase family protein [Pedobacter ghigonis]